MDTAPELPIASLKRLARGLLYDEARAEDVVQEAWLAALRREHAPEGLRAWLSEAVRRIARSSGRDELRRARREERAARVEALPSAAETAERIELLRHLLDAIETLEEPYRGAVVLRYFDELPPRAIAARLGIPVNTARTHVRRGLERLRRELDGDGRGREAFLAGFVPFAGEIPWPVALPLPGPLFPIGALVAKSPTAAATVLVLVLASAWFWRQASRASEAQGEARVARLLASGAAEDARESALLAVDRAGARASREGSSAASTAAWTVRGHAFLGGRAPYADGALVGRVFAGPKPEGRSLLVEHFRTDAQGDFTWSIAPPNELVTVQVDVEGAGIRAYPASDVFLPGDPPPERWTVSARVLDGVLHGVVRDPDGNAVPGARVFEQRYAPDVREVRADGEGRFEFAISSDDEPNRLFVLAQGFAAEEVALAPAAPGDSTRVLVVRHDHRLHGRVVDETGAPLADVHVSTTFPPELAGARTGDDGRFELDGVPPSDPVFGDQVTVWAMKEGFPTSTRNVARAQFESELELRLEHGARLAGRVLAPDGAPVTGAWVSVGYGYYPKNDTYTDADGRFELGPTAAGTAELWVWRAGFAQLRQDVEVPASVERVENLELRLAPPHFLGGIVRDDAGTPIPWAFVFLQDPDHSDEHLNGFSGHSDASGRFRFDGLPAVAMRIGADVKGFARVEQDVAALDRDDVELRPQRAAGLAGRVVDAASGAPIPSFVVRLQRSNGSGLRSWIDGLPFTAADGVWRVDENFARDESFLVSVSAPGYATGLGHTRTSLSARPDDCLVQLVPGARVRGRVVEKASGRPVAGASVRGTSPLQRVLYCLRRPETRTDAEGRFELADLAHGDWTLTIEGEGIGGVDGPFSLTGGETTERWIELGSGGRIRGRLLDARGEPLAGESVTLWGAEVVGSNSEWSATTAADGSYALVGLPAGIFQLRWSRTLEGHAVSDLETLVTLAGGEERPIDLQPRGHTTVSGTVRFPGGMLPHIVAIYASPRRDGFHAWADGVRGVFALDGRFELANMEAGKWVLMANACAPGESFPMGSLELELPAEGEVEAEIVITPR